MPRPNATPWNVDGQHVWAEFLRVRKLVINAMVNDGDGDEQIARTLSMDPMQVRLIAMTDPVARKPKKG